MQAGASGSTKPLPLPDKPSIAELPFRTRSAIQSRIADGMVEDIMTALSKFKSPVRDRPQHELHLRGQARKHEQVGRDLGHR